MSNKAELRQSQRTLVNAGDSDAAVRRLAETVPVQHICAGLPRGRPAPPGYWL